MSSMQLEILTPENRALEAQVQSVYLEGAQGRLGILPMHTTFISKTEFGILEYNEGGKKHKMLCGNGLVEVEDNRVTVLVRSAESADDIDVERAKRALERAKSRLHSKDRDVNISRAEIALARAMHRLRFVKKI